MTEVAGDRPRGFGTACHDPAGEDEHPVGAGETSRLFRDGRLIAIALCLASSAHAQEHTAAEDRAPSDEVVVTGVRESTLDLSRLLKAEQAFRAGRAAFAPTSTLYFQLRPAPGVALAGMTLFLRGGDRQVAVPIDDEGRFVLPDLSSGKWELVHNRGARRIAVRALVLSAGASEADRPLGDLRLQCRAGWELAKANYSFVARAGFSATGGCSSSRFAFFFRTPKPIGAAVIEDKPGRRDLPVRADRSAYQAPLADKAVPNSAMVHIRYNRVAPADGEPRPAFLGSVENLR